MALTLFAHADGHHEAAWRRRGHDPRASQDLEHYRGMARTAEDAALDAVFLADNLALPEHAGRRSVHPFEPLTMVAALAGVTRRIALVATASTSYHPAYHLARAFASLDWITQGRVGWNVVTSAYEGEARNFGRDARADHEARYARAEEVLAVTEALWAGFPPGAVVADVEAGLFVDAGVVRPLDHEGEFGSVAGPLNLPGPRSGRPLVVQAGSSPTGAAFAARHADVVFTAQADLDDAVAFRRDLRAQVAAAGRDPDTVAVLPGLGLLLDTSESGARARQQELDDLVQPEYAVAQLGHVLGTDVSGQPLDVPLDASAVPPTEGMQSRARLLLRTAEREGLTLRQLAVRAATARGHLSVTGTATRAVDLMQEWVDAGAADGFNLMPATLPEGLDEVVALLLPELRRRGLFRETHDDSTLLARRDRPATEETPR